MDFRTSFLSRVIRNYGLIGEMLNGAGSGLMTVSMFNLALVCSLNDSAFEFCTWSVSELFTFGVGMVALFSSLLFLL